MPARKLTATRAKFKKLAEIAKRAKLGRRETRRELTLAEERNRIDPLTGLANRRGNEEGMERNFRIALRNNMELSADRPALPRQALVIMAIDIDKFKTVNDTYGHSVGDLVIVKIAEQIADIFKRPTDVLGRGEHAASGQDEIDAVTARVGGEEFWVCMACDEEKSQTTAMHFADMLRVSIAEDCHVGPNKERQITISTGVFVVAPKHDDDIAHVLQQARFYADETLYAAKESGRNTVRLLANDGRLLRLAENGKLEETPYPPGRQLPKGFAPCLTQG